MSKKRARLNGKHVTNNGKAAKLPADLIEDIQARGRTTQPPMTRTVVEIRPARKFEIGQFVLCPERIYPKRRVKIVGYEWGPDNRLKSTRGWLYTVIDPDNFRSPAQYVGEEDLEPEPVTK